MALSISGDGEQRLLPFTAENKGKVYLRGKFLNRYSNQEREI